MRRKSVRGGHHLGKALPSRVHRNNADFRETDAAVTPPALRGLEGAQRRFRLPAQSSTRARQDREEQTADSLQLTARK
jgi:hypothetical protein